MPILLFIGTLTLANLHYLFPKYIQIGIMFLKFPPKRRLNRHFITFTFPTPYLFKFCEKIKFFC